MKKSFNKMAAVFALSAALGATLVGCDLLTPGLGPKVDVNGEHDQSIKTKFNHVAFDNNGNLTQDYKSDAGITSGNPVIASFGQYKVEQLANETAIQIGAKGEDFSVIKADPEAYKIDFYDPTDKKVVFEGYNNTGITSAAGVVNTKDANGVVVKQTAEHTVAIKVKALGQY